jgi:RNA polymerase sigma-70 factor (ECF subfamily)
MQAVLGQVAPMLKVSGSADRVGSQTLADRAMDRYADGDEKAFGALYDELAPRLFRYALWQTRSRAASEDVVQQTFLQIHCARDRFVRGAAVLTWAYAIARRLLIDASRRRGQEELRGDEALYPEQRSGDRAADDAMVQREQELEARRNLETLPPALRESFQLVKLEGLSVAQAAEVLGITPGMVKIRTHRAKAALERALARERSDTGPSPGAGDGVARRPAETFHRERDTTP